MTIKRKNFSVRRARTRFLRMSLNIHRTNKQKRGERKEETGREDNEQ